MRYLVIADNVAHGVADLLDLATHPEETKNAVKQAIKSLRELPTLEDHLKSK